MPRVATGSVYESRGTWYARLTLEKRVHVKLPTCKTEAAAEARKDALAEMAKDLRAAGHGGDLGEKLLKRAGEAADGKPLDTAREAVRRLVAGTYAGPATVKTASTFGDVAKLWTSGDLARRFPDHVKTKRSADSDVHRLKHILPIVEDIDIAAFELADADKVMALLPPMEVATRRHVAQVIHRVLALSVFPLKLRASNPIPEGWLPKLGPPKAKAYLYPDEDARLLACGKVDVWWRLLYGFLHREGCRRGEALSLQWRDLDLARGGISLDENKTDDPRAWALRADTVEALCAWWLLQGQPANDDYVFVDDAGHILSADHTADRYRAHLEAAGIDRPQLTERTAARRPIDFHATRATFITIATANGKSEAWIMDRTGHRSSEQIGKYRRKARAVTELNLGDLEPLNEAIPELRFFPGRGPFRPDKAIPALRLVPARGPSILDEKANEKAARSGNGFITSSMPGIQVPAGSPPWGFKSPSSHKKLGGPEVGSASVGNPAALSDATAALSATGHGLRHLSLGWDTLDEIVLSGELAVNDQPGDARRAGGRS